MIKLADTLPSLKLMAATAEGPREISTDDIFKGKESGDVLAVPGAFTPTCSAKHLPGFDEHLADFHAKGVDTIVCMAVNDAYVIGRLGEVTGHQPGDRDACRRVRRNSHAHLGLELDLMQRGLGMRSQRFALVADDMKVTYLAVEQPGDFDVSRAEAVLSAL